MKGLLLAGIIAVMMACTGDHREYMQQLESGLASGERYDSLFLTLKFGMTSKEFYTRCWKLNSEGIIMQGPSNLSVEYDLENNELRYPGHMRFYPQFHQDKIYNMPMEFVYQSAMPNDPDRLAEALLPDVKNLLETWYGPGFVFLEDGEGARKVYVKVDGNRRIRIFKKDLTTVAVDITDMPVYLAINDQNEVE